MEEKRATYLGSCKVFLLPDNNRPRRLGKICDRDTERKRRKGRKKDVSESEESPILMVLC